MDWKRVVSRVAADVEHGVGRLRAGAAARDPERPVRIVPYRGYGTRAGVHVRGRVLHGPAPRPATPDDRWWTNARNMLRLLDSDEVPHARVRVRFGGAETEGEADDEGHFDIRVAPPEAPPADRLWHDAAIELVRPVAPPVSAPVAVPAEDAEFGIISDLDDTVIRTRATSLLRMVREVFFRNVHTRIPFPGVGAFYRALHRHGGPRLNPLFYVSSSPWNLYDVLSEFLRLHEIPPGPMELRNWGITRSQLLPVGHHGHKRAAIDRILDACPSLPFILVGDSGQEDPEIYRSVIHDHPDRVLGVYIRSVVPDPLRIRSVQALAAEVRQQHGDGPELVLVENTLAAARHAADRGWIHADALEDVARSRRAEAQGIPRGGTMG